MQIQAADSLLAIRLVGRRLPGGFESSGDRIEGATVLLGGADAPVKVPPTWSSHRLAADEPNVARWLSVLLKSAK